jgi:hypothetical protein
MDEVIAVIVGRLIDTITAIARCFKNRVRDRDVSSIEPPKVVVCCTDRSNLCERCAADLFACLKGTAACRGEYWARSVARRCPSLRSRAWPRTPKSRGLVLDRVHDLTRDSRLRARLADEDRANPGIGITSRFH